MGARSYQMLLYCPAPSVLRISPPNADEHKSSPTRPTTPLRFGYAVQSPKCRRARNLPFTGCFARGGEYKVEMDIFISAQVEVVPLLFVSRMVSRDANGGR